MKLTADQLGTTIKTLCKRDMEDVGEEDVQHSTIYDLMNLFLHQKARVAYIEEWSDELTVSGNGPASFKRAGQDIDDLYEPLMVYKYTAASDKYDQVRKLKSFDGGDGWFRGGPTSQMYLRGQTGTFKLYYLRYPKKITLGEQIPEYPPQGYQEMVTWIVSQLKLPKNFYAEMQAVKGLSDQSKLAATKAAINARGSNQAPPSDTDAQVG